MANTLSLGRSVLRLGIPLVLGGSAYVSYVSGYEDGPADAQGRPQFRNVVYADALAAGLPTACLGLTRGASPVPVVLGDYWPDAKCMEVGSQVLARGQARVLECMRVQVTQPILDAFSSHGHNLGERSTCASRAMGLLNAGLYAQACDALAHGPDGKPAWSFVRTGARNADGGWEYRFVPGLYKRRLDERKTCLRGVDQLPRPAGEVQP